MSASTTIATPEQFEAAARPALEEMVSTYRDGKLASISAPKEVSMQLLPTGHYSSYGMCIFFALVNQRLVYKDRELQVVIGSLGFGVDGKVFWEHGHPRAAKASQFVMHDGHSTDLHLWLQDKKTGAIFDILYKQFLAVALMQGCRTDTLKQNPEVVDGASKKELAERGFHYEPAPIHVQCALWKHLIRVHAAPIKQLGISVPAKLNGSS
jgi:hypothetical protein